MSLIFALVWVDSYPPLGIPFQWSYLLCAAESLYFSFCLISYRLLIKLLVVRRSLIHSLAGELGLDTYFVSLSPRGETLSSQHFNVSERLKWSMSDNTLTALMGGVPYRSVFPAIYITPLLNYVSLQKCFAIRAFRCCVYALGHCDSMSTSTLTSKDKDTAKADGSTLTLTP